MDKRVVLGVDIGGSHIATALVTVADGSVVKESVFRQAINARAGSDEIMEQWTKAIEFPLSKTILSCISGIGISMPGPFDYANGISLIRGVNKYEQLYGLNIKEQLQQKLGLDSNFPVYFENDAFCFGMGASRKGKASPCKNIIAITLGTGMGACFLKDGRVQKEGKGVPPQGYLYHVPFRDGIAEDYFSTRWLVEQFNRLGETKVSEAKEIYDLAVDHNHPGAREIFRQFGKSLGTFLAPWMQAFDAECLILGGNLCKASTLFLAELIKIVEQENLSILMQIEEETELSAIAGAAMFIQQAKASEDAATPALNWRKSTQPLLPLTAPKAQPAGYDIYPFHPLGSGKIFRGYASLAQWIATQQFVL
ncbi:MAG TPA: ROK family protein, partial [Flavisolibacter sp.]|nr:ROK family protein [Flavisolibacter sp.]